MKDCIFCQIVQKEKPSKVIYENDDVLCLLSKGMEVYGHTLIIPKQHFQDYYDIPDHLLCELIKVTQILAKEYQTKIAATGINLLHASGKDAQQSVFHFHFHLFPRFKDDGLDTWPKLPKKEFDPEEIWEKLKF